MDLSEVETIYNEAKKLIKKNKFNENEEYKIDKILIKKWSLFNFSRLLDKYYDKIGYYKEYKKILKYYFIKSFDFYPVFSFYNKNKKLILKYEYEDYFADPTITDLEYDFDDIVDITQMIKQIVIELIKFIEEEKFELERTKERNKCKLEYIEAIEEVGLSI